MGLWSLNKPPRWFPKAVATKRGWTNPFTKEVLVAISNLVSKAGAADILEVSFVNSTLAQGDALAVKVRFNEAVDVTVGAAIEVSWSGLAGNFTLQAAAQTNVTEVLFDKQADNVTPAVVPSESGELSIAAQSLSGTIKDASTAVDSNLAVSAEAVAATGTIEIA